MKTIAPRPEVEALRAYRLARPTTAVKLNQNENPYDWPPEVKAEVLRRLSGMPWHRYPDANAQGLRARLGALLGVATDMVAVTNGSNEAILALVQAFASGGAAVLPAPSYSMARTLCVIGGARPVEVLLREDFSLDVVATVEAVRKSGARLVFIPSPNNPTGNAFPVDALRAVIEGSDALVAVDEAYYGFWPRTLLGDLERYGNLALVRTFSKAFALAGVRVGWITARPEVTTSIAKVLPPYNLNLFAQVAAEVALERWDTLAGRVEELVRERARLREAMRAIPPVEGFPSDANFILFRTPLPAGNLFQRLLARGVLVRDVSSMALLERCLRVSVGTPEENTAFIQALRASLEGVAPGRS